MNCYIKSPDATTTKLQHVPNRLNEYRRSIATLDRDIETHLQSMKRSSPLPPLPARGAGSRTGAKRATAFVRAYHLELDSTWPRCGIVPDPVALDWPPRRLLVPTHGHWQAYTDAARRPSRRLTTPTPLFRGENSTGVSIPLRVPVGSGHLEELATCRPQSRASRSLPKGRAVVLRSRSGGTERFERSAGSSADRIAHPLSSVARRGHCGVSWWSDSRLSLT